MSAISWKDIIEAYTAELNEHGVPEDQWVDSGEVDYDSKESSEEATSSES